MLFLTMMGAATTPFATRRLSVRLQVQVQVLCAIITLLIVVPWSCHNNNVGVVNAQEEEVKGERQYIDDSNVIHRTTKEKPTIVSIILLLYSASKM